MAVGSGIEFIGFPWFPGGEGDCAGRFVGGRPHFGTGIVVNIFFNYSWEFIPILFYFFFKIRNLIVILNYFEFLKGKDKN